MGEGAKCFQLSNRGTSAAKYYAVAGIILAGASVITMSYF